MLSCSGLAVMAIFGSAMVLIERWRQHYNSVRPRSSLGYRPPASETILPSPAVPAYAMLRPAQQGHNQRQFSHRRWTTTRGQARTTLAALDGGTVNAEIRHIRFLCALLHLNGARSIVPDLQVALSDPDCVKALIDLANWHYLTPALWAAIEDRGCSGQFSPKAVEFLQEAHRLNTIRNSRIKQQALELLRALDAAGVKTVLLKGGVYLFEGDQRAFETRMMLDLDILVPQYKLEQTVTIANRLGYKKLLQSNERFHQLDPLGRTGDLASVEIHRDVGQQRHILPAQEVLNDSIPLDYEGQCLYVPTPTHRVTHTIFHSEVQGDGGYVLGRIPLRYLHDLMLLRKLHGAQIDWAYVLQSMSKQDYQSIVPGFLYLGERLFGMPIPNDVPVPASAKRHYIWCLAQVRSSVLRAVTNIMGTITYPIRRPNFEYVYGFTRHPLDKTVNRVKYLRFLLLENRLKFFPKLLDVYKRISKGA